MYKFDDFFFLLKSSGKNFTEPRPDQVIRRDNTPSPAGVEPTFREFVDYVIDTDLGSYGDDHWMPYYLYCTPCLVKYNIIANVSNIVTCTRNRHLSSVAQSSNVLRIF